MARIPDDELERLKQEVLIERLAAARGVELKRVGRDLRGRCPFHEDSDPSLSVDAERNVFHCFGCGAKGSVVDWVMKAEGVSFRHAVEILREMARGGGPASVTTSAPPKRSSVRRLASPVELDVCDHELMLQVVDYYHATLKESAEAQGYLRKRGVGSPEAVEVFKLGFANRTLGLRLPNKQREEGLKIRHRLERLGLIRPSGHEHFNGSLVIPIFDEQGRVVEVYGRKIRGDLHSGTAKHLYLPGPRARRGVFNLDALRSSRELILCEALLDALTFWCAGFPNVTSAYGVNGFTDEHLEAMKSYGTERVLIAYDRDEQGEQAAQALAKKLAAEGITSFRVLFPRGMDANEYALKVKPAAQALGVVLRAAEYLAGPLPSTHASALQGVADHPVSKPPAAEEPAAPTEPEPLPEPLAAPSLPEPPARAEEPPPLVAAAPEPASPPFEPPSSPTTTNREPTASPASPIPPPPRVDIPAEVSEQEVVIRLSDRRWRVRGLARNLSFEQLRVNVMVGRDGVPDAFHVDTLDLYSAKQRVVFLRQAAPELALKEETLRKDLGLVLLKLEELQELQIRKALEPKQTTVVVEGKEREQAMSLLADPRLLERVLDDFERCGVVGERTNKLVGYLAAVSRKLDRPLAVMVQSSSAAGKSALMSAILAFVPEEERVAYSAMTGQSLFYMGEADLEHKVLAIAEEEGAERASYALKQLQSEGELSIASTGKDPATGRLLTHEYRVKGPTALLMTTTAIDLDEELMNRCVVLTVDEDREQTQAIHRMQREAETLDGYFAELDRKEVLELHRNAQRLLRPLRVVNPYARRLTFLSDKTRTRRDHLKYLALIRAIALLHQHQRPVLTSEHRGKLRPYVEVTLADIEVANRLAAEVLGRTLDELPPQTRRFLVLLLEMVRKSCEEQHLDQADFRFTRADIRRYTAWSYDQVRVHMARLVDMEYVLVHHGGRGQSLVYELLYSGEGEDGASFLMGLIDVASLARKDGVPTTVTLGGQEPELGGEDPRNGVPLGRHLAPIGVSSGRGQSGEGVNASRGFSVVTPREPSESTTGGVSPEPSSYAPARRSAAARG